MDQRPTVPDDLPPALKRWLQSMAPERRRDYLETLNEIKASKFLKKQILSSRQSRFADELLVKLMKGFFNLALKASFDDVIQPHRVAEFLAWLAFCQERRIPQAVKMGLEWLGIKRVQKKGGRPRGRNAETEYSMYVAIFEKLLDESGVWKKKVELTREHPRAWQRHLRAFLGRKQWNTEWIDLAITSKTPRSFAIHTATAYFGVSYDAIERACRRKAKPAKTPQ